jgi:hypothetical protein
MKSLELKPRVVPDKKADAWLQDIRERQGQSLDAVSLHGRLKRRFEISSAFTFGVLLGVAGHLLSLFSVIYAWYALGIVSTIGVVVSLVYLRLSSRAFLESTVFIRAASSTIKIVADDESPPPKAPEPETNRPAAEPQ